MTGRREGARMVFNSFVPSSTTRSMEKTSSVNSPALPSMTFFRNVSRVFLAADILSLRGMAEASLSARMSTLGSDLNIFSIFSGEDMLRFNLLWIGKTRESWIRQGIDEYVGRLSHYLQLNITEIRERTRAGKRSPAATVKAEGEQILRALPEGNIHVVVLDSRGRRFTSKGLADQITRFEERNFRDIFWVIGGAHGIARPVMDRADTVLSLSDMTFTHDMTRVILLEQLYRACTIRKGERYHH